MQCNEMEDRRTRMRSKTGVEESDEGELDSSSIDDNDDDDEEQEEKEEEEKEELNCRSTAPAISSSAEQTSQSWTSMLNEQNLSSIMSNAFADHSQIIHIDDPITQQSENPLNYGFPQGTDVVQFFERKQKQVEPRPKYSCNRRELKRLAKLLNGEKNLELLRVVIQTLGHRRAFDLAQQAIHLYKNNDDDSTLKQRVNGRERSLGGTFFKMLIFDQEHCSLTSEERERIKRENQRIQKEKKKLKKTTH